MPLNNSSTMTSKLAKLATVATTSHTFVQILDHRWCPSACVCTSKQAHLVYTKPANVQHRYGNAESARGAKGSVGRIPKAGNDEALLIETAIYHASVNPRPCQQILLLNSLLRKHFLNRALRIGDSLQPLYTSSTQILGLYEMRFGVLEHQAIQHLPVSRLCHAALMQRLITEGAHHIGTLNSLSTQATLGDT